MSMCPLPLWIIMRHIQYSNAEACNIVWWSSWKVTSLRGDIPSIILLLWTPEVCLNKGLYRPPLLGAKVDKRNIYILYYTLNNYKCPARIMSFFWSFWNPFTRNSPLKGFYFEVLLLNPFQVAAAIHMDSAWNGCTHPRYEGGMT